MNIYRNETLIKRNARIAKFAMIGGLAVLAGGMFLSFQSTEYFSFSLAALLVGFLLSQVGIYFTNRWGRSPRPDEVLDQGLKGLDKKYSLYHFASPVSHLLVGPAGVWVLMPYYQRGTISYTNGRWKQRGGNLYLKIFAQEGLGRPDIEIRSEIEKIIRFLNGMLPEDELPEVQAALVFYHPDVQIEIPESEEPQAETIPISKLKDLLRKAEKSKSLSTIKVQTINDALLRA